MSNFYLPIYNDKVRNNIKIYNMEYNRETINEFLEYVRISYQDKYLCSDLSNDLMGRNVDPLLYTILVDMVNSEVLDLRFLEVYLCVNFRNNFSNNYTENDKFNLLLQLKNNEVISKDIDFSINEEICNLIYKIELQQVSKNLTISEKNMTIKEFENLVFQFFNLFDIEKVELKRNYMEYIMNGKDEIASINSKILSRDSFQKVYKKIF